MGKSIVKTINILDAKNNELLKISKERLLSLTLQEMLAIKNYFKSKKRNPTDLELEMLAQTWSEHCKHKVFNGKIYFQGKIINGLFSQYIKKSTNIIRKRLAKNDFCVSVFEDNAGIIKFNNKYNIAFKVETHNHPSALDPYGGANTGIGGVIRDILGCGLGAKPIFNTDIFCFADISFPYSKLPSTILHPKRIYKGVVAGVRDYGNRMGIPIVNGSIHFDDRYLGNPIVYCGTGGIIPKDKCKKKTYPNDLIVTVGGRTGRDGIHGATFSSAELTDVSEFEASHAVQIGNPIEEKKVLDILLKARDRNLYRNITDCGAGGFSSAIGEMAKGVGAVVNLEKVPLKYKGLLPWEIFLSESQERMVVAVPPEKITEFIELCESENVSATVIGKFENTGNLKVFYNDEIVCDIDLEFLHNGLPKTTWKAEYKSTKEPKKSQNIRMRSINYSEELRKVLSDYNVASKESIIRQYDFEVMGGTILKPLVGINNDGPSDASVLLPDLDDDNVLIIANGINVRYGDIDPYFMALSSVEEALRNIIAVGGNLSHTALLDNFCWGNPNDKQQLGALVKTVQGCYDSSIFYKTPFISGKDSFYNEYLFKGKRITIPYTLLISAISVTHKENIISMDFKNSGNLIYIIGITQNELGGSIFYKQKKIKAGNVPKLNLKNSKQILEQISKAIERKLIKSCHDLSDGGMAVALAEMSFSGGLGIEIFLKDVPRKNIDFEYELLFSESNSRFIVEVEEKNKKKFETLMEGIICKNIGKITGDKIFKVYGFNDKELLSEDIFSLKECWQKPLTN